MTSYEITQHWTKFQHRFKICIACCMRQDVYVYLTKKTKKSSQHQDWWIRLRNIKFPEWDKANSVETVDTSYSTSYRKTHLRSTQVWHMLLTDLTVLPANTRTYPRKEWTISLSSQSKLVLISRPQMDSRLSWAYGWLPYLDCLSIHRSAIQVLTRPDVDKLCWLRPMY